MSKVTKTVEFSTVFVFVWIKVDKKCTSPFVPSPFVPDYDFLSVEIISKGNKSLDLVTFYITKNKLQNNSFANTSKSGLASQGDSQPAKVTVPQTAPNVNDKKSILDARHSDIGK